MNNRWHNSLPRPIAFALSGGSSLGAIQVGMLQALAEVGLEPDLVVGTSVGALNGATIAEYGLAQGSALLTEIWNGLTRQDIFPGGRLAQIRQLLRTRLSLFPQTGVMALIEQVLSVNRFEQLSMPFGVTVTELPGYQGKLVSSGDIRPILLASTAIPGIFQPVRINGASYVDGGLVENVPLKAALDMGAKSIVVLDAGNTCLPSSPRHIVDIWLETLNTVWHQRAKAEAPLIANICPVLYISSPCPITRTPFNFDGTSELIETAAQTARLFLERCPIPRAGLMCGGPHSHDETAPTAAPSQKWLPQISG